MCSAHLKREIKNKVVPSIMSSCEASKIITILCPVLGALSNIVFLMILIMVLDVSYVKHFAMVQKTVKLCSVADVGTIAAMDTKVFLVWCSQL